MAVHDSGSVRIRRERKKEIEDRERKTVMDHKVSFTMDIFEQFDKKWALLTAGSMEKFNTMTVSWGGLGTLWGKPVATVYVRQSRYTHEFMDNGEYFTVSFYPVCFVNRFSLKSDKFFPLIRMGIP